MLAFTVQFSRYGRNQAYSAPIPGNLPAWPYEVSPAEAAAPSGPNSVLTQSDDPCARSASRREDRLLTAPSRPAQVNNQCSTRKHGRPVTHTVTRGAGAP